MGMNSKSMKDHNTCTADYTLGEKLKFARDYSGLLNMLRIMDNSFQNFVTHGQFNL